MVSVHNCFVLAKQLKLTFKSCVCVKRIFVASWNVCFNTLFFFFFFFLQLYFRIFSMAIYLRISRITHSKELANKNFKKKESGNFCFLFLQHAFFQNCTFVMFAMYACLKEKKKSHTKLAQKHKSFVCFLFFLFLTNTLLQFFFL